MSRRVQLPVRERGSRARRCRISSSSTCANRARGCLVGRAFFAHSIPTSRSFRGLICVLLVLLPVGAGAALVVRARFLSSSIIGSLLSSPRSSSSISSALASYCAPHILSKICSSFRARTGASSSSVSSSSSLSNVPGLALRYSSSVSCRARLPCRVDLPAFS